MRQIKQLCDIIRETGFAIRKYHRHGHAEKVYENALAHRLRKHGLNVVQQHPLPVFDEDGTLLGDSSRTRPVRNKTFVLFVPSCG